MVYRQTFWGVMSVTWRRLVVDPHKAIPKTTEYFSIMDINRLPVIMICTRTNTRLSWIYSQFCDTWMNWRIQRPWSLQSNKQLARRLTKCLTRNKLRMILRNVADTLCLRNEAETCESKFIIEYYVSFIELYSDYSIVQDDEGDIAYNQ